MVTRKRQMKPDAKGRYRPRIGFVCNDDGTRKERRFNLGTDKKEAEWRYAKIQKLYEENCQVNGVDVWSPLAFVLCRGNRQGKEGHRIPATSKRWRVRRPNDRIRPDDRSESSNVSIVGYRTCRPHPLRGVRWTE